MEEVQYSDNDVASPEAARKGEIISERDFVLLLISLYRESPTLWYVKSKDYLNKNKRLHELVEINNKLLFYKPWFTVESLKKKINTLRTNFNKERNKLDLARKSADSTDDEPTPTLWYFNEMLFLTDQHTGTKDNENIEQMPPEQVKDEPKQKIYKTTSNDHTVNSSPAYYQDAIKRRQCESEVIAKSWAMKLKRLCPDQKRYAEKIINDVLFEGAMGTLTRNGVSFL